jgi:hypothetical protein
MDSKVFSAIEQGTQKGIQILKAGGIVAFPTDTVYGLGADGKDKITDVVLASPPEGLMEKVKEKIRIPNDERLFYLRYGLKLGLTVNEIYELSKIDRWFIDNMKGLVELERVIASEAKQFQPKGDCLGTPYLVMTV